MTDPFTSATQPLVTDFKRNGRGQPLIVPAGGGKPIPYNRPSSWGKKIEDMYGINQWEKRCVVTGMSRTPSLIARAAAITADTKAWTKADKDALNLIAEEAKTAARSNQAADIGTALHRMTERADLGENLADLPEPFASDIAAYTAGMAGHDLVTSPALVECRMVCDELKLAGTADRVVRRDGVGHIFDLKTGESIELAALGYAVQLAIYAHSDLYDVNTGQRTPADVDMARGLIGHLPAGQATFTLHEVDIAAGWEAALLAAEIDRWRKRRGLLIAVPGRTANAPVEQPAAGGAASPPAATITAGAQAGTDAVIAHLRQRCQTVATIDPNAATVMASTWPEGVPALNADNLTTADLEAIDAHISRFETVTSAPFAEPVTNPQPTVEAPAPVAVPALPELTPDEGPTLTDDDPRFARMQQAYLFLDDTGRNWMARIIGESIKAKRSIHMGTQRSLRRVLIVDGLVTLAVADLATAARGIASTVLDQPLVNDPQYDLGSVISLLNADQAAQFADLAQQLVAPDLATSNVA